MEILKLILFLFFSITIQILLALPRILVFILSTVEAIIRIFKETLTFFIEKIESEVLKLKPNHHAKRDEKNNSKG